MAGAAAGLRLSLYRARVRLRRRLGSDPARVFCIGFNKTGTTSLHELFEVLGYRSYHGLKWHDLEDPVYDSYECFSDGFPLEWRMLPARYPTARFVLNVRECRSWILSRLRHIARARAAGTFSGGTSWGLWDETVEAVVSWIELWHAHHLGVLRAFRDQPDRLLVVNMVSDRAAPERVAAFLGYHGPIPRPHANRGHGGEAARHHDLIERARRRLGVPRAELDNDLCLPSLAAGSGAQRVPSRMIMAGQ